MAEGSTRGLERALQKVAEALGAALGAVEVLDEDVTHHAGGGDE